MLITTGGFLKRKEYYSIYLGDACKRIATSYKFNNDIRIKEKNMD